jgi:hypothetical protein
VNGGFVGVDLNGHGRSAYWEGELYVDSSDYTFRGIDLFPRNRLSLIWAPLRAGSKFHSMVVGFDMPHGLDLGWHPSTETLSTTCSSEDSAPDPDIVLLRPTAESRA